MLGRGISLDTLIGHRIDVLSSFTDTIRMLGEDANTATMLIPEPRHCQHVTVLVFVR